MEDQREFLHLEQRLNIVFRRIDLLQSILTDSDCCHREAWVGDSLIDSVLRRHLIQQYPRHAHCHTIWRSELVSNRALAKICQEIGLDALSSFATTTRLRGTLFEALVSVVCEDHGLPGVKLILQPVMLDRVEAFVGRWARRHPHAFSKGTRPPEAQLAYWRNARWEAEANEYEVPKEPQWPVPVGPVQSTNPLMMQLDHLTQRILGVRPVVQELGCRTTAPRAEYAIRVYIRGHLRSVGRGPTKEKAEALAVRNAFQELQTRFPHLGSLTVS